MTIPVPKKRDKGFSVMGAVGSCIIGGGFFTKENRTEGVAFRSFILKLKD